jgi:hypothetical protein
MNILAKKLTLIEWITEINDEKLIKKIEEIKINSSTKKVNSLKEMSIEEFMKRYTKSEKDIEAGNLIAQEEAKKYFSRKHGKSRS